MTVQTSAVDAAITYLVTAATMAFPTALVLDGPFVVADQAAYQDMVAIGWDGVPGDQVLAVDGDQDWGPMTRAVVRNEQFSIECCVKHWDGDNNVPAARAAARQLLATFEGLMRGFGGNGTGDATLGGAVTWAGINGGIQWFYETDEDGTACRIVFHVSCFKRLTGS